MRQRIRYVMQPFGSKNNGRRVEDFSPNLQSGAVAVSLRYIIRRTDALTAQRQKYIPADYVGLTSLGVSVLLGVIAIAATNGFHGYGWGIVLTGVIGVAQAVYTLVNQAFSGKLSKDNFATKE